MSKNFVVEIVEDGEDLIIPIPETLTEDMGWKVGDVLNWTFHNDYVVINKSDKSVKEVLEEAEENEVNLTNYYHKGKLKV